MRRLNQRSYIAVLALAVLLSGCSACSGPAENAGASNTNAAPGNSNSSTNPQIASRTPSPQPAPPAVQPIPPPSSDSAAVRNANSARPAPTANARAPKLVVREKKIDFGKQPQGKTLVRTIAIKNSGLADLNIESVVPG